MNRIRLSQLAFRRLNMNYLHLNCAFSTLGRAQETRHAFN